MIKVAVLGAGGIGKTHLDNLKQIPYATVTDICDVDKNAAAVALELGANYYISYTKMLKASPADVVLVCTPTFLHYEQVEAVIRAGKHCICEKPLCLSSVLAQKLFNLAQTQGVQLFVGQVVQFWPEYRLLAELIHTRKYGAVLDACFYRLTARPGWVADSWLFDESKSGLLPFDLHIHDLDFIVSLFGKPQSLQAYTGGGNSVAYREYYRVEYGYNNITVCAEASWYNADMPFYAGFRVYFENAVVLYDGKQMLVYPASGEIEILSDTLEGEKIQTRINVSPTYAYMAELEHFVSCIQKNEPSGIITSGQVVDTLEILEWLTEATGK